MARVKGGIVARKRRKKILKEASGYFGSKHRLWKTAKEQLLHSGVYAYRDRRQKKRDFRKLWITRINAACRENEISYSKFIDGLNKAGLTVNRKMLSELAIDNPKGVTQYGGTVSAPVAKSILTDCINILGIEEDENVIPKNYNWNDTKYYTVPNVVGLDKKDAIKELKNFTITYTGSGNIVKEQTPSEGSRVKYGGKIRLLLGE